MKASVSECTQLRYVPPSYRAPLAQNAPDPICIISIIALRMKWSALPQEGDVPLARSSHSLSHVKISDDELLVLWGGENSPRVPLHTDVYIYAMSTGKWTMQPSSGTPPSLRVAHAAAVVGTTIYIHGGRTEVAEDSSLGDFYSYDVCTSTWTQLDPEGPIPPSRNYHAACAVGTDMYIFGGCGKEGRLADLWRYDTVAGTWEELPSSDAIKGRGGAGFVAADGAQGPGLWVIGGFIGREAGDVHRFDLQTRTWEQVDVACAENVNFTARSVFAHATHSCPSSLCGHNNHIIVYGGEIDPSDLGHAGAGQFSDATMCLDSIKREWHTNGADVGGETPGPRGWGASTAVPGGMVIHGGIDDSNARLGDMYFLDLHDAQ